MKKIYIFYLIILLFSTVITAQNQKKGVQAGNNNASGSPSWAKLNINNVSTYFYNNGSSDVTPTGDAGFIYPKGSGKNVFFQSGPLWGGLIEGYWAAGGSAYRSGLVPGRILPNGTAEDVNSPSVRIYRVRSDYKNYANDDEMKILFSSEMQDEGKTAAEIFAQYDLDWKQWPAQYGAPFIDNDADGIYNPDVDIAGMSDNQCQTIWFAANDLNASVTQNLYGALPMKVELQGTFWAMKGAAPGGNTIFRRYKLINRNSKKIDSMYMCIWSDPDLGGPFDDLTGCDSILNLGYVYNGSSYDDVYGANPPAAGFVLLQTPYVAGQTQDKAKIDFKTLTGYRNLGMTGFFMFCSGVSNDWSDPVQNNYAGSTQFKNLFQGKLSRSGSTVINSITGRPSKFMFSGDPASGSGWIDGVTIAKSDRRMGLVSGPFTMNPNDTQQIIAAQLAAGGGKNIDKINAVLSLKYYSRGISNTWLDICSLHQSPAPVLTASEYDGQINLNWWDESSVTRCEADLNGIYKFQGYNVYQFPKAESALSDGILLAVYDKADNLGLISGWIEDPVKGYFEYRVLAFGSNSGIKRFHTVTRDVIGYNKPLYDFTKYYFGVTSYYAADDPQAMPRLIESPVQIVTAIPQANKPGERFSTETGDQLTAVHTAGIADGTVSVKIIDPNKGDGNEYTIKFANDTTYSIYRNSDAVYSNLVVKGISEDNPIVAGGQVNVKYPELPILKNSRAVNGTNPWSVIKSSIYDLKSQSSLWNGGLQTGNNWYYMGVAGTGKGSQLITKEQYHNVLIKFADTDIDGKFLDNSPNASLGYRFVENAQLEAAKQEFVPFIKSKKNYGYQEFGLNGKANIPVSAYDRKTGKRLAVGMVENNSSTGKIDGKYWPAKYTYGSNLYPHEILLIFADEYSTTPNPNYIQPDREIYYNSKYGPLPIMYSISAVRDNSNFSSEDEVEITVNNPFTTADRYTFTVPGITNNAETAKEDVNKINVFPNPYYGINPQEGNSYQRFVTFTHLPNKAIIRIFNVGGQLIKIIEKDDNSQTVRWNLATTGNFFIASGIYVARIELPELGKTKTVKFAVIMEQQYPGRF